MSALYTTKVAATGGRLVTFAARMGCSISIWPCRANWAAKETPPIRKLSSLAVTPRASRMRSSTSAAMRD